MNMKTRLGMFSMLILGRCLVYDMNKYIKMCSPTDKRILFTMI